jgi:hypothetical protein
MDPFTLGLILQGSQQAAAAGAGAVQAAQLFTEEDRRRKEELEAAQAAGELGLSDADRGALEEQARVMGEGAARQTGASSLQRLQSLGSSGQLSGRDLYLAELGEAQARQQAAAIGAATVAQADLQAAAEQEAELAQLEQQRRARAAGMTSAILGGLGSAAGQVGGAYMDRAAFERQVAERKRREQAARERALLDTRRQLQALQTTYGLDETQSADIDRLLR